MKKLLLLPLFIVASCSTSQVEEPAANCDCDKVVERTTFNVVGTPQNPAIQYNTVYTTINECTQIQKTKTFNTTDPNLIPQIGQCR